MQVANSSNKNGQYNPSIQNNTQSQPASGAFQSNKMYFIPNKDVSSLDRSSRQIIQNANPQSQSLFSQAGQWVRRTDSNLLTYFKNNAEKAELSTSPKITNIDIKDLVAVQDSIRLLSNKNTTNQEKASAVTNLFSKLSTYDYAGTVNKPEQIQGVNVVGSASTEAGKPAYLLANGKLVEKDSLKTAQNFNIALNTIKILQGDSKFSDKLIGLTGNAVALANANDFLSDENAGYVNTALGAVSMISNWGDMSNEQRVESVTEFAPQLIQSFQDAGVISSRTGGYLGAVANVAGAAINWENMDDKQRMNAALQSGAVVINALDDAGYTALGSTAGSIAGGAAGVAGIVTGVSDAVDVFSALSDMPRSEGREYGAIGVGSAGAAIGAGIGGVMAASAAATGAYAGAQAGTMVMPVIGTVIGAVVGAAAGYLAGSFGSSKTSDQMMRDQWRNYMEKGGFANKINGSHHVMLADGSAYNIGFDGKHKLQNLDGTQRNTFDVDWGNQLAAQAIPEAHIFALATGLDPSMEKGALWHRGVAQSLNAATSNAQSQEDVSNNFRSMLLQGKANPIDVALRVEVLRQENKISEQEYGVYMNKINNLFGTSLVPTDKAAAAAALQEQGYVPNAKSEKKK